MCTNAANAVTTRKFQAFHFKAKVPHPRILVCLNLRVPFAGSMRQGADHASRLTCRKVTVPLALFFAGLRSTAASIPRRLRRSACGAQPCSATWSRDLHMYVLSFAPSFPLSLFLPLSPSLSVCLSRKCSQRRPLPAHPQASSAQASASEPTAEHRLRAPCKVGTAGRLSSDLRGARRTRRRHPSHRGYHALGLVCSDFGRKTIQVGVAPLQRCPT